MSSGTTIYDAMRRLGPTFQETPLPGPSLYIKPSSVTYEFDGKLKRWDCVENHASIGVVLYHKTLKCFLIVRQFRPAVYCTELRAAAAAGQEPPSRVAGFTYELCAGLMDKAVSIEQVCKEEIQEEVGYDVPLQHIHSLGSSVSSAGTSGARHSMFYAEVDEAMHVDSGGGLQGHAECIEVLTVPIRNTLPFIMDASLPKSPGLMFGLLWAYHHVRQGGGPPPDAAAQSAADWDNPNLTQELTLAPVLTA